MKALFLLVLFSVLVFSTPACKEVKKTSPSAGVNVMIQDISCQEVIERVLKECQRQGLPFEWADKDRGLLSIGPLISTPLPADPFSRMEEKVRLEIKCLAPLSTRVALQMHLKGLASDNQWTEVVESEKLNAYGKRFLERLVVN
ncbi:MAG: hypothetical protein V2B13_05295 [Pseudomonadota bacterium]